MTKPFSVSYSKMSLFRRCRQQYHWKYIDKIFPPSSMGQMRGTCGHAALAKWHVEYDPAPALQAAWDKWSNAGYENNEEWQLLEDALSRYFIWSKANDTFVLKVAEQKFEIEYGVDGTPVMFIGYIDGIVEEDDHLWLLENKFLKRMSKGSTLDMQVSTYMLAAKILDYNVQGVIYNKVRVADTKIAGTEPVVRSRMYRNPVGLGKIQDEIIIQIKEMLEYHQGGEPYRNPTRDCSWDCSFHQPCLSMLDDGMEPTELLQSIAQIRRNDNG